MCTPATLCTWWAACHGCLSRVRVSGREHRHGHPRTMKLPAKLEFGCLAAAKNGSLAACTRPRPAAWPRASIIGRSGKHGAEFLSS